MGLFGRGDRKRKDEQAYGAPYPVTERDQHLPALTVDQAARFTALAQRAFSEAGIETVPQPDRSLRGQDGGVLGLYNVAHLASEVPESEWPRLLAEHAGRMARLQSAPTDIPDLDSVRDTLYLRVHQRSELQGEVVGTDVGEDLVAIASIDHPEYVRGLTRGSDVRELGPWEEVERVGLANLARLHADDTTRLDQDVHIGIGGFFQASRVLTLPQALASDFRIEQVSHGCLVAMPNRHVLAVHPLVDERFVGALQVMTQIAAGEFEKPGGLSRDVWFWRDGALQRVSSLGEEGIVVRAEGRFADTLTELGLLGG